MAAPLVGGILLRTETVQRRIREGLSLGTGMKVKCESFQPGLWSATRMTRLTASGQDGSSLSANDAYVKLELLPLLTGRLVFREIRITGVRLVCIEPLGPAGAARGSATAAQAGEPSPNQTSPGHESPADSELFKNLRAGRVSLLKTLRALTISDAAIDWQLADGRTKMQMEGMDLQLQLDEAGAGTGAWTAARGTWMDLVQVKDLQANLRLAAGTLNIEEIKAACGEGGIRGAAEFAFDAPEPFSFHLEAAEVDLEKMSEELPSLRLSGKAEGGLWMHGMLAEEASWTGGAKLGITNGRLKGVGLLQMIGQVFQIQEIANFQVRHGLASLRIADRKIWLDALTMDGGDLLLSAPGTVDFQRNLALDAKLSVPDRLLNGRVAQLLSRGFSGADEKGLRSIAFQIAGTIDKPSTNLLDKVVGEGLGGVVNQLLGGFLKPRKAEKTDSKEPSTEAPR